MCNLNDLLQVHFETDNETDGEEDEDSDLDDKDQDIEELVQLIVA